VDAVQIPVIATGGLCDARQTAAALLLGASAVQIGTGLLRCPEVRPGGAGNPTWETTGGPISGRKMGERG
jgi:imidazole glycerol phosphate synthase subunit HisF